MVMVAQLYKFRKTQTVHLQWVNFMLCKLHLNKAVRKVIGALKYFPSLTYKKKNSLCFLIVALFIRKGWVWTSLKVRLLYNLATSTFSRNMDRKSVSIYLPAGQLRGPSRWHNTNWQAGPYWSLAHSLSSGDAREEIHSLKPFLYSCAFQSTGYKVLSMLPKSAAIIKRKHRTSVINVWAFSPQNNSLHAESTKAVIIFSTLSPKIIQLFKANDQGRQHFQETIAIFLLTCSRNEGMCLHVFHILLLRFQIIPWNCAKCFTS